jgi:NAD(P)-dependent dehydrogenase (short-subunit alcohol dehydrogenase family)
VSPELHRPRVLLTGATGGIGREVARVLAGHGARMVLVSRRSDALEEVRAALPGEGHEILALDVRDEAGWAAALELIAPHGRLEGLVTAAGVLEPVGPIGTYTVAAFRETVEVNLLGTLLAIVACLPALRVAGGSVVTFSGGGGTVPLPRFDAYAASKAAVVRLTENLACELRGENVRLNAVAPGMVATDIHAATLAAGSERVGADYHERTRRAVEEGAAAPPSLAAELTAFLLSGEAAGISGKLLSAQWDPWREPAFRARLRDDDDLATLRRIDDQAFAARP